MKKKLLLRGLLGVPLGIAIGHIITVIVSLCIGDGLFYPVRPELVGAMRGELNAVLLQTALCYLGDRFMEPCKAKRDLLCNRLRGDVSDLLRCKLDAPFDRRNPVLCRDLCSHFCPCLADSIFRVEKEGQEDE